MQRWVLDFYFFSIRLHRWFYGDDIRAFHDHPWNFWSLVLSGQITDISDAGKFTRGAGTLLYFKAEHKHTIQTTGCWTLLVTGKPIRDWGFWVNGKFKKRNRYFYDFGHHNRDNTTYRRGNNEDY